MTNITLQPEHFDKSKYNEHFVIFLHATKRRVGDTVHKDNYNAWINGQLEAFKKREGIYPFGNLNATEGTAERFTDYLRQQVEQDQLKLF
ncbi:hypothetical protein [Lysinibacillus sp. LZ02]|uniref:hypothetical protein n=1 Tax=Lysinibacillus sp. LZ02 TaxID=3420668 RepID=UPI003D35DF28